MLIISKFHDYYDRAAVYGVDKTVVYRRDGGIVQDPHLTKLWETYVPREFYSYSTKYDDRFNGHNVSYGWYLLGYCGDIYPLRYVYSEEAGPNEPPLLIAYESSIAYQWKEKHFPGEWPNSVYAQRRRLRDRKLIQDFFDADYSRFKDVFLEYKVPLFLLKLQEGVAHLDLSPCLTDLQFTRFKDAPTAFQDIYMYISGVLGVGGNPTVELTDEMRQAKHGHDGPYSFKKPPGKKTRWR